MQAVPTSTRVPTRTSLPSKESVYYTDYPSKKNLYLVIYIPPKLPVDPPASSGMQQCKISIDFMIVEELEEYATIKALRLMTATPLEIWTAK